MISTAEYVRPCGDGCHQRKQEACSGDQWNCPRIAGYRRAPIGSEKTGPILEARACGIEAFGIFDLTSATLSHNLRKQPRQSSSIALLFSFLLLHWLRSTRDPRRHTRLGSVGLQRTTCTVPSEGEREREREICTHVHSRGELVLHSLF